MRALVVGASGQLGGHLLAELRRAGHLAVGTFQRHPRPGLCALDLEEEEALAAALRDVEPDVVFLPAGWTWVDGNETDPERADRLNAALPLRLAARAVARGARFVAFSSDYVFDGAAGPYREDDPPGPLNAYGRAKRRLEEGVLALGEAGLVLRTSTVYGPELQGKNFVYQLVRRLRAGEAVQVPSDQVASPTYGPDLAVATLGLVERGASGLWHAAGPEAMDRASFARAVCAEFELDAGLLRPLPTAALGQKARRPLSAALDSSRLRALGLRIRGVREGLSAMRRALVEGSWASP